MDKDPSQSQETISKGELIHAAEEIVGAVHEFGEEIQEFRSIFTGPVPPPELLSSYENVLPGLADRLVTMAEKEGDHRRRQESKSLDAQIEINTKLANSYINDTRRGQRFAFIIGIFAIGVGGGVAVLGQPIVGGLLGSGGLIGLVSAFINGRNQKSSATDTPSLPDSQYNSEEDADSEN